jgi:hypothetical protein
MSENVSREETNETRRARPVRGGKATCAHCDNPHAPGHALCRDHKNAYQREWSRARTAELHRLKAIAEGMK